MPKVFVERVFLYMHHAIHEGSSEYTGSYQQITRKELALIREGEQQQDRYQRLLEKIIKRELKEPADSESESTNSTGNETEV